MLGWFEGEDWLISLLFFLLFLPFKSNDYCDEDGTTDSDVVERVEELGEEESVELSSVWEGPVKDSGHAVVEQTEDKEEIVKACKDYEEVVERVLHILRGENVDGEDVAKESKDWNRNLRTRSIQI